jgi:hypothetical protein
MPVRAGLRLPKHTAKKDVATAREPKVPATEAAFFDTDDTGYENVKPGDLIVPRYTILQGLSPQVTKGKPEYDADARVGQIYNVGLQEVVGDEMLFLPAYYAKQFLEWAPRSSGKGLVAVHDSAEIMDQTTRDSNNRPTLGNGNYIAETAQFFGFDITEGTPRKIFIPMASTQLKKARRLLTLAMSEEYVRDDGTTRTPPIYYRVYKLTTVPESNQEGSWVGWKIERDKALRELDNWQRLAEDAKRFREMLTAGKFKGDMAGIEGEVPAQRSRGNESDPL